MRIQIEGSSVAAVDKVYDGGYLPLIELDDGTEWHVAEDSETAGEAAAQYWRDMAENDPAEFTCIVGEKALITWGLGQNYAPGNIGVNSLEEWFELTATVPEEQWAGYDSLECDITRVGQLATELGFTPTVAYRNN